MGRMEISGLHLSGIKSAFTCFSQPITTFPPLADKLTSASYQDEAREQYCNLIGSLVEAEGGSSAQVTANAAGGGATYETLLVTTEDDITTIKLNRPAKKNAITPEVSR